ncbi:hypothetical protein NHX12_026608, partial [Muraenolepis orangiensis]
VPLGPDGKVTPPDPEKIVSPAGAQRGPLNGKEGGARSSHGGRNNIPLTLTVATWPPPLTEARSKPQGPMASTSHRVGKPTLSEDPAAHNDEADYEAESEADYEAESEADYEAESERHREATAASLVIHRGLGRYVHL